MCQVHTGAYVSLLTPGETDYTACRPRKTTTYILHVVSITTHMHDRRKLIGENKQRKEKDKERKKKRRKRNKKKRKERKENKKTRKARKTKQGEEARKGKEKKKRKKNVILTDPRNWLKTALGSKRVSSASSMALGRERNMAEKSGRSYAIL